MTTPRSDAAPDLPDRCDAFRPRDVCVEPAKVEAVVEAAKELIGFRIEHCAWCATGHGPDRKCDCGRDEATRAFDAALSALEGGK